MAAFTNADAAIKALWAARWPTAHAAVPVFWHENTNPTLPDPSDAAAWLHLAVEFDAEDIRAFGGGPGANDRVIYGSITIRVFAAAGTGEATALDLLSDAVAVFAGRRSDDGALSCIGPSTYPAPQAALDGVWWYRVALVSWQFRYQG